MVRFLLALMFSFFIIFNNPVVGFAEMLSRPQPAHPNRLVSASPVYSSIRPDQFICTEGAFGQFFCVTFQEVKRIDDLFETLGLSESKLDMIESFPTLALDVSKIQEKFGGGGGNSILLCRAQTLSAITSLDFSSISTETLLNGYFASPAPPRIWRPGPGSAAGSGMLSIPPRPAAGGVTGILDQISRSTAEQMSSQCFQNILGGGSINGNQRPGQNTYNDTVEKLHNDLNTCRLLGGGAMSDGNGMVDFFGEIYTILKGDPIKITKMLGEEFLKMAQAALRHDRSTGSGHAFDGKGFNNTDHETADYDAGYNMTIQNMAAACERAHGESPACGILEKDVENDCRVENSRCQKTKDLIQEGKNKYHSYDPPTPSGSPAPAPAPEPEPGSAPGGSSPSSTTIAGAGSNASGAPQTSHCLDGMPCGGCAAVQERLARIMVMCSMGEDNPDCQMALGNFPCKGDTMAIPNPEGPGSVCATQVSKYSPSLIFLEKRKCMLARPSTASEAGLDVTFFRCQDAEMQNQNSSTVRLPTRADRICMMASGNEDTAWCYNANIETATQVSQRSSSVALPTLETLPVLPRVTLPITTLQRPQLQIQTPRQVPLLTTPRSLH